MRDLFRRLWSVARARQQDDELAEELESHRRLVENELLRDGLDHTEAATAARRRMGNDTLSRNRARDQWIAPWLQDLAQDLRLAMRVLGRDWRFSLAVVVVLGLPIGANVTAFTFLNGTTKPLPFPDPDQLVAVRIVDANYRPLGVSYADARDWRDGAPSFSHLVVSFDFQMNVSDPGVAAQRYVGSYVPPEGFTMVGAQAALGRTFLPEDDQPGAPPVAVLAHSIWQSRYAGDPAIVGRTILINDMPTTVVGVMPERFHFPGVSEIWQPSSATRGDPATLDQRRGVRNILAQAIGRLKAGVPITQAQAELDAVTGRLASDYPTTNQGVSARVIRLQEFNAQGFSSILRLFMAAVIVVLLVACINIGTLLLARTADRSRELAIRASLGGSRWRIVRQLLVESAIVAAAASALGLAVARFGVVRLEGALNEGYEGVPVYWFDRSMDGRVVLFLLGLSLAASALFSIAPAALVMRTSLLQALNDGGRGSVSGARARRWTEGLMVAELALTVVLLGSAALLTRGFVTIYQAGLVLDTSNLVTMRLTLSGEKYAGPARIKQFFRELDQRLAAQPSLRAVTVASDIPLLTMTNSQRQLAIRTRPAPAGETPPLVAYLYVGPRYLETVGLPVLRGRSFTEADGRPGQEGAIVNQEFVSRFFSDEDPVGQQVQLINPAAPQAPRPWFTIVGVVPTVPQLVSREKPEPVAYVTIDGEPAPHRLASILARTDLEPGAAIVTLRETVRQIDNSLAGYFARPVDDLVSMARSPYRLFGTVFALLAAIALVVSAVGLYALTARSVAQRTPEIGVRIALGAQSRQVLWLFLKRLLVQVSGGLMLGLAGATAAGGQLRAALDRTPARDPVSLVAVAALVVAVTAVASVLSARRATRVDPIIALRHE